FVANNGQVTITITELAVTLALGIGSSPNASSCQIFDSYLIPPGTLVNPAGPPFALANNGTGILCAVMMDPRRVNGPALSGNASFSGNISGSVSTAQNNELGGARPSFYALRFPKFSS